ncbi:MAG: nuclear transport factor 2 family protein [Litorimonas sp.]
MKNLRLITMLLALFLIACSSESMSSKEHKSFDPMSSAKMLAAANIVDAVNAKSADQYGRDLHSDVLVKMYDGAVVLRGRDAVIQNRRQHFENNPDARNELIHLVEIDNRVVMHDKVWLDGNSEGEASDIVEVFTFEDDKIIQIDVIQPADLFADRAR